MAGLKFFLYKFILLLKLMRLHQPTGIWLLLWPCWWSIALASPDPWPSPYLLALFAIGAIVMRGAGCIINDMVDRKIDAQVARTKHRPLASGVLKMRDAYWLLVALLVVGLVVVAQLNRLAVVTGFLFCVLVVIYPFMKRYIRWPQVVLAITFNAGAIVGWAAASGDIPPQAWLLYAACFFWTLGYDTIYAHQDKRDDTRIGVKSTAVALGERTRSAVTAFYLMMVTVLTALGFAAMQHGFLVYFASLGLALAALLWQIRSVDLDSPEDCMRKFRSNARFGWIIFLGIIAQRCVEIL